MLKFLSVLIFIMPAMSFAAATYDDITPTGIVSVYDGDTFKINVSSYPDVVGKSLSVRLRGLDTPEKRGKCQKEKDLAKKAQIYTSAFVHQPGLKLTEVGRGKYFRIVASAKVGDRDLTTELINMGYAVPYDGGTKTKDWCK